MLSLPGASQGQRLPPLVRSEAGAVRRRRRREVPRPVLCKVISSSVLASVHILSHCHDRQAAESLSQSLASAQLQSVGEISEI